MKDLHTHILYGIDDGAKNIEESLEILKKAYQNGVTDIVLTPHYIKDSIYETTNEQSQDNLKVLHQELQKNNIHMNLYLGNEVYITENINSLINTKISTINNSRYILIELPMTKEVTNLNEILKELQNKNLIPIIAHPERYLYYYKNYEFFNELINKGCLLQGNIGSIYGYYGRKSKKMLIQLLKQNMIHILATDTHHNTNTIYEKNYQKDLLKILKNKQKLEDLLINNPDKIIKNKELKQG